MEVSKLDKRRRQYVPLYTGFAVEGTGPKLLSKFGTDGLLTWVCLLTAAKRARVQGTFTYVSEDGGWHELGLGCPHIPAFTLESFFTYTGRLKKTRKRVDGQLKHIEITGWGDWNDAWRREDEAERKSRKRAQNTPDMARTLSGHSSDKNRTEVEGELDLECEGESSNGRPVLSSVSANSLPFDNLAEVQRLMTLIGDSADEGTRLVLSKYARLLPPAALGKVIESVRTQPVKNRAAYANAALQSEINERRSAA